eukprot:CAMPEP_0178530876 /NCGR_PEP_ID=MMETSP0696-20121128/33125_1 /TAXON_ID=265572 /ORGANISM="Extubocellulus spinifer, Strain CCMP396" /LENGTH=143 /DNA_ID=CAMNT_0020162737 /DNA_START=265 /DNA_END=697 /DNA_ORIENTATION=+
MTVRRIFLQNLVGPMAACRRIVGSPSASSSKTTPAATGIAGIGTGIAGTGTGTVRRTRFHPSTQLKSPSVDPAGAAGAAAAAASPAANTNTISNNANANIQRILSYLRLKRTNPPSQLWISLHFSGDSLEPMSSNFFACASVI